MDYEKNLEKAKELYKKANKDQKYVLESLFHELKESEEERIRKEILDHCKDKAEKYSNDPKYKNISAWIAWLEKHEQKPDKWSEEDEKFFVTALWHMSYSISNGESTDIHCDTTEWFKSLKDRYTWKPSEEQIDTLEEAMYQVGILTPLGSKINDLYEQLKKLKGE